MDRKIFVVTGANRGIGYGITKGLGKELQNVIIYLTARNPSFGEEALKKIKSELGEKTTSEIHFHQLDITDETSCKKLATHLEKVHHGLDVLINNAGISYEWKATERYKEQVHETIEINYYGTKRITTALLPLIKSGGRIVNVCSESGTMKGYPEDLVQAFKSGVFTEVDIENFIGASLAAAEENIHEVGDELKADEMVIFAHQISKAAEVAYSIYLARILECRKIIVNACCPGKVDTRMNETYPNKAELLPIDQGADTPVYLATTPNVSTGVFYVKRKPMIWIY